MYDCIDVSKKKPDTLLSYILKYNKNSNNNNVGLIIIIIISDFTFCNCDIKPVSLIIVIFCLKTTTSVFQNSDFVSWQIQM